MWRLAIVFTVCVCFVLGAADRFGDVNVNIIKTMPRKIRPCKMNDYKCIRDNIAVNSGCNMNVKGYMSKSYKIKESRFETPYFNASYVDNDLIIHGLDKCFISEFFIDTKTNTGILGIDCPGLTFESNRTLYQHYPLKEDNIYSYQIAGTYPLIRITSNLHTMSKLDFCSVFNFAYVAQLPKFKILANDMHTKKFLSYDLSFLNIYERECFFHRADMLARLFVNGMLCHFGCDY